MKNIINKQLQKINQTEQLLAQAKNQLKTWASQISQHHKTLKALSQQLEAIKGEINKDMKTNNNLKGEAK